MDITDPRSPLLALQCDIQITQMLLDALFAESPRQAQIQQRFRESVEAHCKEGLKLVHEEHIVELRARAAQIDRTLSLRRHSPSASGQSPPSS